MTLDPSKLCQVEIPVRDVARSLLFFKHVFDWVEAPCDIHGYHVLHVPENCPFGISLVPTQMETRSGVVLYFAVDEPDLILRKAVEFFDGQQPAVRVLPDYGKIVIIKDADGNRFGLYSKG